VKLALSVKMRHSAVARKSPKEVLAGTLLGSAWLTASRK
jgi:hypothetical protein